MQEELNQFKKWAVQTWAKSLVFFLALMIGMLAGNMLTEGRIINDFKYIRNLRIGEQSDICLRKI